ncbi:MAG: restriction endonuclease [Thaumarchaeota archaeon]|nr:restriction endonuclease [Nitrososphaerota archaeon]
MNSKDRKFVIKSDGTRVPFEYGKVRRTCMRAGASRKLATIIANRIAGQIRQDTDTREVYRMVLRALSSEDAGRVVRHRYRLKESIMRLGPSGTKFEEFVARILEARGYQILSLRSEIGGECVRHEVDISAHCKEDNKNYMIECKYHSLQGIFTGIKESLYTHARFLDLREHFDAEMLVTNTKVSEDVMTYSSCIGQEILSWRYPRDRGLERLIEENGLYPLTILPLSKNEVLVFYKIGISMAKDLLSRDPVDLSRKTGISASRIRSLQDLTREIIS